jgi:cell wall-associated NlpC family hydrolase
VPLSRFRLCALTLVIGSFIGSSLPPGLPAITAAAFAAPAKPVSKAALDQQISSASDQLSAVVEQYDAMRVTLAATKAKEASVAIRLAPLQRAESAAHAKVAVIAANVYQQASPAATLGHLLDASTTPDLVNQLGMIDELVYAGRQQLAVLRRAAAAYLAQKQKLSVLDHTQTNEYGILTAKKASILVQIEQLKSLRLAAYGPTGSPPDPLIHYLPVFTADAGGRAVRFAYDQLGKSYRFGASGPSQYDCSGLTMSSWQQVGVQLPHSAAEQYRVTKHVTRAELRPGDLVFYFHPIHHVGIYVGADKVINAPTYGEPVKISPLDLAPIAGYSRP